MLFINKTFEIVLFLDFMLIIWVLRIIDKCFGNWIFDWFYLCIIHVVIEQWKHYELLVHIMAVMPVYKGPGGHLRKRCCLTSIGIPMIKIRWSCHCLIFNGIPIPGKDSLYIETGPWLSSSIVTQFTYCMSIQNHNKCTFSHKKTPLKSWA